MMKANSDYFRLKVPEFGDFPGGRYFEAEHREQYFALADANEGKIPPSRIGLIRAVQQLGT